MRHRFRISGVARHDLISAWKYLSKNQSPETADRVLASIRSGIDRVGAHPGIAHWREDLVDRTYQFYLVNSFFLVLRKTGEDVELVRVIHASRDIRSLLGFDD